MSPEQYFIVLVSLASFKFWQWGSMLYWNPGSSITPGFFGERHRAHLCKFAIRYGSTWTLPLCLTAASLLLLPWWSWQRLDPTLHIRLIILLTSGVVTWRAVTMDIDLATGESQRAHRLMMIALWLLVWLYPGFLILLVHVGTTWLRSWSHHQHMPIRILLIFLGCLTGAPFVSGIDAPVDANDAMMLPPFLLGACCVVASHYFVPGVKKLQLGSHWYSWPLENRLHNLTVGAYVWGWLGWLPESFVMRFVRRLRSFDVPVQVLALVLELSALLILLDVRFAIALMILLAGFHLVTFALGGILFWQSIATCLALAGVFATLPGEFVRATFGPANALLVILIVLVFPCQQRLWKPIRLGWWDSPFYRLIEREVRGRSGTLYKLGNDFLCPHDRLFGQLYGSSIVRDLRITDHLGEVQDFEVCRDLRAVEDIAEIAGIKERYGREQYNAVEVAEHDAFLRAFFENFNAGRRKRSCPWWLKAPGGQLFYWGSLPRFKGQEPIDELVVRYKERFYDGSKILTVEDRVVSRLDFSEA